MGEAPTPRQLRILQAYADAIGAGLPGPTFRDLMARFGWTSTNSAADYVRSLVKRGLLAKRGIRVFVTDSGWRALGLQKPAQRRISGHPLTGPHGGADVNGRDSTQGEP